MAEQPSSGRITKAPENFLSPAMIADVQRGRRDFLRGAFAGALSGAGAVVASGAAAQ
ncbi:MAG: sulfite dehydrogenase, partial [Rhodocyclaceae bacterium]|nr:sulfite dehydrogenase [Rhodocyclaceae bacterium]